MIKFYSSNGHYTAVDTVPGILNLRLSMNQLPKIGQIFAVKYDEDDKNTFINLITHIDGVQLKGKCFNGALPRFSSTEQILENAYSLTIIGDIESHPEYFI